MILHAYGGSAPVATVLSVDTDAGWNAFTQLEIVPVTFTLRDASPVLAAESEPIHAALANFLFAADELFDRPISDNVSLNAWKVEYQQWDSDVVNFIRERISETSAYHFSNTGLYVLVEHGRAFNEDHNSLLNALSVRRENLRHIHRLETPAPHR
jgi:hypothetical protein